MDGVKKILKIYLGVTLLCFPEICEGFSSIRFASLRSDKVNIRVGPGKEYPVCGTYHRAGLPVLIVGELDIWRKIRDMKGGEAWVHKQMLMGQPTVVVHLEQPQNLHRQPDHKSPLIARVDFSVVGKVLDVKKDWCYVQFAQHKGWIHRSHVWGAVEGKK
jgi:SH3-like domain-containing protein